MPIVTVPSDSARIHSWLSAYLSSLGTFTLLFSVDEDLAVAYERRFEDLGRKVLAAHRYFDGVAGRDARRHARERDRLADRGTERSAGRLAVATRCVHALMRAQHATAFEQQQSH